MTQEVLISSLKITVRAVYNKWHRRRNAKYHRYLLTRPKMNVQQKPRAKLKLKKNHNSLCWEIWLE
jgi:hypothetical protein